MIVMKFGGTSVANAERIEAVKEIVSDRINRKPIVVSSALGKTTDLLIQAGQNAIAGNSDISEIIEHHQETATALGVTTESIDSLTAELKQLIIGIQQIKEISPRTADYLVSFGERCAVRIIADYFNQQGIKAKAFDAWELGMATCGPHQSAMPIPEVYERISGNLQSLEQDYSYTPIITGFIGKNSEGDITTFGRGGSDLTATTIGAAMKVEEIQVWKDVSGLMTADPRVIKNSLPVDKVSFEQASELAYFGANVLHPLSMRPAKEHNVPVRVKNSYQPEDPGTIISNDVDFSDGLIKSITRMHDITLIDICSSRLLGSYGFLAKVFSIFDKYQIVIDVLATSEVSVSFTVEERELPQAAIQELEEFCRVVSVLPNHAIISMVCDAANSSNILHRVFADLKESGLHPKMISQGASKVNISFVFNDAHADLALEKIHESLLSLRRA